MPKQSTEKQFNDHTHKSRIVDFCFPKQLKHLILAENDVSTLLTNEILGKHSCVCVCLIERKKGGDCDTCFCVHVQFYSDVYEWVVVAIHDSHQGNPCFPHRDTLSVTSAQHLKTVTACHICSITPSCLLPQCRLSRNNQDSISSVVTPGYSHERSIINHERLLYGLGAADISF